MKNEPVDTVSVAPVAIVYLGPKTPALVDAATVALEASDWPLTIKDENDNTPLPFVINVSPLEPLPLGKVNVLSAAVAGACSVTCPVVWPSNRSPIR